MVAEELTVKERVQNYCYSLYWAIGPEVRCRLIALVLGFFFFCLGEMLAFGISNHEHILLYFEIEI